MVSQNTTFNSFVNDKKCPTISIPERIIRSVPCQVLCEYFEKFLETSLTQLIEKMLLRFLEKIVLVFLRNNCLNVFNFNTVLSCRRHIWWNLYRNPQIKPWVIPYWIVRRFQFKTSLSNACRISEVIAGKNNAAISPIDFLIPGGNPGYALVHNLVGTKNAPKLR